MSLADHMLYTDQLTIVCTFAWTRFNNESANLRITVESDLCNRAEGEQPFWRIYDGRFNFDCPSRVVACDAQDTYPVYTD